MSATATFAQGQRLLSLIDSLSKVEDLPFDADEGWWNDCGDDRIWSVVKYGKAAINPLVAKLSDTTLTNVRFVDLDTTLALRRGDLAYVCLREIVFLPTFVITKIQFHAGNKGVYHYQFFSWLSDYGMRLKFQAQVRRYLGTSKRKWEKYRNPDNFSCQRKHGIVGSYE